MTIERTEAQLKAMKEMKQRQAEELQGQRELCGWLGLTLICPEAGCRRAGRCAGAPGHATYGMPPCLMHYREEMRFLLIGPDDLLKELEAYAQVDAAPVPDGAEPMTLLELLYGRDHDWLERLRRPKGVGGPGCWEADPEGFARYMDEGDWRNPGRLASSGGAHRVHHRPAAPPDDVGHLP